MKKSIKVFVSSPYTLGDAEENVKRSLAVGDELFEKGFVPFLPLLYHYWNLESEKEYEDWMKLDFSWLDTCDCLLRLDGESPGGDREVKRAFDLKIPVFFSLNELESFYKGILKEENE